MPGFEVQARLSQRAQHAPLNALEYGVKLLHGERRDVNRQLAHATCEPDFDGGGVNRQLAHATCEPDLDGRGVNRQIGARNV